MTKKAKHAEGGGTRPGRNDPEAIDQLASPVPSLVIGFGVDERLGQLQRAFEVEMARTIETVRSARRDLACARDKLRNGLSLALYTARKAQDRHS